MNSSHRLVRAADDLDRLAEPERRLQEPPHQRRGQDVRDADDQPQRLAARPSLERVDELAPEREDLVGVAERDPAGLGEHEVAPPAGEQLLAQDLFEPVDLAADRRMRQAQLLARPDDAALLGDHPEVEEVVVVEPLHARRGAYVVFCDDARSNFRIAYMAADRYPCAWRSHHGSQGDPAFRIGPPAHRARLAVLPTPRRSAWPARPDVAHAARRSPKHPLLRAARRRLRVPLRRSPGGAGSGAIRRARE